MKRLLIVTALAFAGLFIPLTAAAQVKGDNTPPVVSFLSVEPELIDTRLAKQVITVTLLITDDVSGIHHLSVFFRSDMKQGTTRDYIGLSYQPDDKPLSVALTVPVTVRQYSVPGRWRISHIEIVDMSDNTYLHYAYPECLAYPTTCIDNPQVDGEFSNIWRPVWLHLPLLSKETP